MDRISLLYFINFSFLVVIFFHAIFYLQRLDSRIYWQFGLSSGIMLGVIQKGQQNHQNIITQLLGNTIPSSLTETKSVMLGYLGLAFAIDIPLILMCKFIDKFPTSFFIRYLYSNHYFSNQMMTMVGDF